MKLAPIPRTPTAKLCKKQTAVIPLKCPEKRELEKGDYESLQLYTNPTNTNPPTYDVHIAYFDSGTPEEFLVFQQQLKKVFTSQNLTSWPQWYVTT